MNRSLELPGWDIQVSLTGTCRECGADLSGALRVRATPDWVARYHADEPFQRAINQSIRRSAIARHERVCQGQRIGAHLSEKLVERRAAAWAVPA